MSSISIAKVQLKVGMEIHVELATRTKMFTRVPSPAFAGAVDAEPNTLIDPVVLALPGALPVMNKAAIEMSMMVGLALRCSIAPISKWDRKSYFYPDNPKAYQISQYDMPLCFDGAIELPAVDPKGFPDLAKPAKRIGIIRAHLEEDAGKLLHEAPGGGVLDCSIVDLNRAGTPLLEIVTQPDFETADEAVLFARMLRNMCRFLGVTQGVMQKGHVRFEPNINTILTLADGHVVTTPIVEVKNLNSFRSLKGAIEHELSEQPKRWLADGRVHGPGMKSTRGWDDTRAVTFPQREKEDAEDYRYFPDPDLVPVVIDAAWRERVASLIPEMPLDRFRRYVREFEVGVKEAWSLVEDREACDFYESCVDALSTGGVERFRAGKAAANVLLQSGARRANDKGVRVDQLGISPEGVAGIALLKEQGKIGNQAVDDLFGLLCETTNKGKTAESLAHERGMLIVHDDAALDRWIDEVFAANQKVVEDVKAGKTAAAGRLVGEVMKKAAGKADARAVRERIAARLEMK